MSLEHVIPAALGGNLVSRILCKECNSRLGHKVEGRAKNDPTVRALVSRLSPLIPDLATRMEEGQTYFTVGPGGSSRGHLNNGDFFVHATRLPDGSLTQSTSLGSKTIKKMLKRQGLTDSAIEKAIAKFEAAQENIRLTLAPGIEAVKWSVTGLRQCLDGPMLNHLVPIKSAYEFLALHAGTAIYANTPTLDAIRDCLQGGPVDEDHIELERLEAPVCQPFHGLAFEGNRPYAHVQLRLFGQLAFRVHFKRLAVDGPRAIYTHNLASGQEFLRKLDERAG